jgi:hypothetical protein
MWAASKTKVKWSMTLDHLCLPSSPPYAVTAIPKSMTPPHRPLLCQNSMVKKKPFTMGQLLCMGITTWIKTVWLQINKSVPITIPSSPFPMKRALVMIKMASWVSLPGLPTTQTLYTLCITQAL